MRDATLVWVGDGATAPLLTICCGADLDDGLCFECETVPPQPTEFGCSCGRRVVTVIDGWMECLGCGACWETASAAGSAATGWDPARASHLFREGDAPFHPLPDTRPTWDDLFAKLAADL
ncbi:hypothetical protein [Agromyces humi]|uniref:hypothetical protein n=1 Tax=Agromyces humi TaxID=1766800 RepID=UPI001356B350|nr:hypothetical protein [Agromyces humi]